jgi:dephospho-CoA kinase
MLHVALTGGIGTGKTVVREHLARLGAATINADGLAHAVLAAGQPAAAAVRARFGPDVMTPDGNVNRRRLADIVFTDAAARRDLEAIVHPAVYAAVHRWMRTCERDGVSIAVAEIPLLFETDHQYDYDVVVTTACDEAEQLRRIVNRGADPEDAKRRVAAQWPLAEKVRLANFVVRTDGDLAGTLTRVDAVWEELQRLAGGGNGGRDVHDSRRG